MTDAEFANLDDEDFDIASLEAVDEIVEENSEEPEVTIDEVEEDTSSEHAETEEEPEKVVETEDDDLADDEPDDEPEVEEPHNGQEPQPEDEDTEQPSEEVDELDYKAMYEDMMGPVKVGGKEFKVKSVADAKKLLGMGFSFSDNMQGVKPLRAIGKTLEEAGIIVDGVADEAALMRLIDINNGDKDALAQLMADKDIDPLDMETENISYTPTQQMVTEQSVDIAEIERELVSRGSVDTVIDTLSKMDTASKEFFNAAPENLLSLDEDIKNGVYEKIMGTVTYERSLGRLNGMSDMDAYIQIASANPVAAPIAEPEVAKPKNLEKRKAAGIASRAPIKKITQPKVDLVNMSDEEFEKFAEMGEVY